MALCPNTVASSGKPQELYFALKDDIPAPQVLSQSGNTISLSGGGGAVNVASATAVALSTQKLTAATYDLGFNATNFSGLVKSEAEIISAPNLGQGSATLNGGLAEVTIGAVPPMSLPKVRFQKSGFPDATMEYTGAAFTFNPPLTDSDFQTLSIIGNDLTISGGNTVDLSGMPVITALQDKTQNITAVAGTTDVSGILHATQDIQTDSIFISKGLPQPRVEFHDGAGVAQGQVGWNNITDRTLLYGTNGFKINSAGDTYKIEAHPSVGYLGIETKGSDIEMRHYDATATAMETRVKVETAGAVRVVGGAGDVASVRVEGQGGKGGAMRVDEATGETVFEAQNGLKAVFKEANANTRLVFDNSIADTVSLKADGQPTIRFEESGGSYFDLKAIPAGSELQLMGSYITATSGALEGVKMGSDTMTNSVAGINNALPFVVAHDSGDLYTNTIKFESGAITTTADALVGIGTNNSASAIGFTAGPAGANVDIVANGDDTGKISLIAQTSLVPTEITIDGSSTQGIITAKADIIEFSGAGLQSGSAGGNSGEHLVIKLNGVTYKIALLTP